MTIQSGKTYNEMDFNGIQLKNTDKYYAAPLALAWSLSSVNNEIVRVVDLN